MEGSGCQVGPQFLDCSEETITSRLNASCLKGEPNDRPFRMQKLIERKKREDGRELESLALFMRNEMNLSAGRYNGDRGS